MAGVSMMRGSRGLMMNNDSRGGPPCGRPLIERRLIESSVTGYPVDAAKPVDEFRGGPRSPFGLDKPCTVPRRSVPESHGLLAEARQAASPNRDQRPRGGTIDLLVIHNISLPPRQFGGPWIEHLFLNRLDPDGHPYFAAIANVRVSAHLLIRRDGELVQFVDLYQRAWHAGQSSFAGRSACNDYSIGIELEGSDDVPFTDAQYDRLAGVTRSIRTRFPAIVPSRITGHSDIAPGRKTDPGPAFDWMRYRATLD